MTDKNKIGRFVGGAFGFIGALACASCNDDATQVRAPLDIESRMSSCDAPTGELPELRLSEVVAGLDLPTFVTAIPGTNNTLLVLEQPGLIRVVQDGALLPVPFLDLTDRVHTRLPQYSEWGLLGLAFHPGYEQNGRLFVHYSGKSAQGLADGDGVVSEFSLSPDNPLMASPASERTLMVVPQPELNHNGGMLEFNPQDGLLYLGFGDGGGQGDPNSNGQNLDSLLGKMLRIDVDQGDPYGIPDGNLSGEGVRPEIWSYGLRNPWRFSFDECNGDLYIGDVGQNLFEEIDFEPAGRGGRNYGWNILEASSCFSDVPDDPEAAMPRFSSSLESCQGEGVTPPVLAQGREFGCSLTAGYVYRGGAIPALRGSFLYTDYCSGQVRALRMQADGTVLSDEDLTDNLNPGAEISSFSSFGKDNSGELYLLSHSGEGFPSLSRNGGILYRIEPE